MKKLISMLLTVVMVIGLIPATMLVSAVELGQVSNLPAGWETEEYEDFVFSGNEAPKAYASPADVTTWVYKDVKDALTNQPVTFVKSAFADKDTAAFTGSGDYASFTINKSAEIYLAFGGGTSSWDTKGAACAAIIPPSWVGTDGWQEIYIDTSATSFGGHNGILAQGSSNAPYNIGGRIFRPYKKTFIVKSGQTQTVSLKGCSGGSNIALPYIIIIKWLDSAELNFTINQGGTVKLGEETISQGSTTVAAGGTLKYKAIPDSGYYVKSISYGDVIKPASFDAVEFDITPTSKGENITVEFSNSYDFSSNTISIERYTDEADSSIKQKIKLTGTVADFMKGKTLKAAVTDGTKTENFSGVISEDGSYSIVGNTSLVGEVEVSVKLVIAEGVEAEVVSTTKTIESTDKINAFIDKVRDIENYSDADFVLDLTNDGADFGFETEIYLLMSDEQKLSLIAKIKEGFIWTKLEDLIAKYDANLPLCAVNNAKTGSIITKTIEKYPAYFSLSGNIYDLYKDGELKAEIAENLIEKTFLTFADFKTELYNNTLLKVYKATADADSLEPFVNDNLSYFSLTNEEDYNRFSSDAKKNVYINLFAYKSLVNNYSDLIKYVEYSIENVKESLGTSAYAYVTALPDGWEVEDIAGFENFKYYPFATPADIQINLYKDLAAEFSGNKTTLIKAPFADKDSDIFKGAGEYASFKLHKSADIYIAFGGGTSSWVTSGGSCLSIVPPSWVEADGFKAVYIDSSASDFNGHNGILLQGSDTAPYNIGGRTLRPYKKSVVVPKDGFVTVTLKGCSGGTNIVYPYVILVRYKDNISANFEISAGGTVKTSDNQVITNGENALFKNTAYSFTAVPDAGYYVKSVTYGKNTVKESLDAVEFDHTFKASGETIKVEFSNVYDFSSNEVKTVVYTDEADSDTLKKKIQISGKVQDFLKGKTLKATATDGVSTESFTGVIAEDGTYNLVNNTSLVGAVTVTVKLEIRTSDEVVVSTKTLNIENTSKVNSFVTKAQNMGTYADSDFAADLTADGEEFGFDTEIYNQMSQSQKLALIADIKEDFIWTKLEDLVEKYNTLIPVHAVSNANTVTLIKNALKKYDDALGLTAEDMYGRIYDLYTANNETLKSEILTRLLNKNYTLSLARTLVSFKQDLCDSTLLTEYKHTVNVTEVGTLILNNLTYFALTYNAEYSGFEAALKNDVHTDVMSKKAAITTYPALKSAIDSAVYAIAYPTTPGGGGGGLGGGGGSLGGSGGGGGGGVSLKPTGDGAIVSPSVQGAQPVISLSHGFLDVPADFWATEAISYLVKDGVLDNSTGKLEPDNSISRTGFTKLIIKAYSLLEEASEDAEFPFIDIDPQSEDAKYILSAKNLGIINGTGEKIFGGKENITRQDACVIILRALDAVGNVPEIEAGTIKFKDSALISDYAKEAVQILSDCGIIKGDGVNFKPLDNITNAETAQLIYNLKINAKVLNSYFESVVKKEFEVLGDTAQGAGSAEVDYGYNQGSVEHETVKEPEPHAVLGVVNIYYKNEYLYMTDYPFIENGRTLAPVRTLEHFGMTVSWNGEENLVTVTKGNDEIKIKIGENTATVNGAEKTLDVPARIVNQRTYVPLRFIAETLNMKVEWDDENQTVILK